MPLAPRSLEYSAGFVGPPFSPDQVEPGCPNWQNARLTLEGERVEAWPGFRRTLLDDLWDEVRQDEIRIIQTTPKAGGRDDGSMVVALDGVNGRVLSLGHFAGGTAFPETNGIPDSPIELGTMLRHGNHDYVNIVTLRGKMILNHPFDQQRVWDGDTYRLSGVPGPKLAPRVTIASGTIVERDDGATGWTSSQAGIVTMTSVSTAPAWSGNYNNAAITSAVAIGNLAFRDVAGTIGADVTRVRMALRNDHPTEAIPRLKLNIIFADAVTLGGTTIVVPVDTELPPLTWTQVDLVLPTTATLPFTYASFGVALASTFEDDLFNQTGGVLNLRWDSLETSEPTTGALSGNWFVGFTWYDEGRDRESALSLFSSLVQLGGSEGMSIDLAGGYPGIDGGEFAISAVTDPGAGNTGDGTVTAVRSAADAATETWTLTALGGGPTASFSVVGSVNGAQANATSATAYSNDFVSFLINDGAANYIAGDDFEFTVTGGVFAANSNPDPTNVNKFRLYLSKTVWGVDDFGRAIFRRALEEDIPFANSTGQIIVTFTDQKDENQLVSSAPFRFDKGQPPATQFSIADRDRILHFGQPDYTVGEVGVTNNSHLVTLVAGTSSASRAVPGASDTGDGGVSLVAPTASAVSEIWTLTATGAGPAATFTVVGSVSGAQSNATSDTPYSNTFIAFTIEDGGTAYASGDSFVIITTSAADNTPQFGPWAEGRQVRVGSDDELYTVVRVLDTNDDGTFNGLWIGRGFNFNEPYQGSTDTDTAYVIQGRKNRVWFTTKTAARGSDVESVTLLGFFDVEMPGDEITGGGHLGRQVVICGRNHVYVVVQNPEAVDDFVNSPAPFARPSLIKGAPGCIAGRTFVELPGGRAMWLGPNGKLVMATLDGGIGFHPLADRLKGWVTDNARVAQERLQFSHAFYDPTLQWYALMLQESLSSANVANQIQDASTNRDPPADFEAVNTTNGYDFPWPWTDGADAVNDWDTIAVPMVEFTPFSPRIGPADMTAVLAPVDSTDGITGGFIRNPGWNSRISTGLLAVGSPNEFRVTGGWVQDAPAPLNEQRGDNSVSPSTSWHNQYPLQRPENGYYHFLFSSTNMPVVPTPPLVAADSFAGFESFYDSSSNLLAMLLDSEEGIRWFFYVYFDAPEDRVIPPGTFTFQMILNTSVDPDSANNRYVVIDQPIRGGRWNLIELDVPAFNNAGGYIDINSSAKDVVQYEALQFILTKAVDASVFDDNNELNLYFTGGRQVKATSDITVTSPTAGSEAAYTDPCSAFGETRDTGPILVDFDRVAVVDEATAAAYIGKGYNLSTTSGVSSSCSAAGVNPDQVIGGGIDGYISKVFSPDAYGLGTPMEQNFWTVIGGGADYVLLNTVGGGMVGGADPMGELVARLIHPDGTTEDRIISESGTDYVQVTENWTTTPTTGTLIIGPMDWFIQPTEKRFLFPASPAYLTMNVDYDTPVVPEVDITVFGPPRENEVFASEDNTLVSRLQVSLADIRDGEGKIGLPSVAAKAVMYRIGGVAQDRGTARFGPIEVEEQVREGEV